jgi:hypothetical protein
MSIADNVVRATQPVVQDKPLTGKDLLHEANNTFYLYLSLPYNQPQPVPRPLASTTPRPAFMES